MYTNPPLPPPPYQYVPPPPPPPRKSHSGIIVLAIVGSGLLGLFVLIGMVAALGGSGTKPRSAEAATASTTTTTTRPMTTTTSRTDALIEWGQESMPTIKLLQGDLDDITSAAEDSDIVDLRSACESLGDHARQLRRYLPTPGPAMTVEMEGVVGDFGLASTTCVSATRTLDTSTLKSAISYLESGTQHIKNATAILDTYDS